MQHYQIPAINRQIVQILGKSWVKICANLLLTKCAGGGIMENLARGVRRRATQMSSVILLNFYKNNRGFRHPCYLILQLCRSLCKKRTMRY